jgi:hypothetical protein
VLRKKNDANEKERAPKPQPKSTIIELAATQIKKNS